MPRAQLERRLKRASRRMLTENDRSNILRSKMEQLVIRSDMPDKQDRLNKALSSLIVTDVIINYIPQEAIAWLN